MILAAGKSSEKPVVSGRRKCQRQQDRRRGLLCTDTTFWRGLVAVAFVGFTGVTNGEPPRRLGSKRLRIRELPKQRADNGEHAVYVRN